MHQPVRSLREQLIQTLWFELGAVALIAPAYSWAMGVVMFESLTLFLALALVDMSWLAIYNSVFDRIEYRWRKRLASERPPAARVVHCCLHEVTVLLVSCPVIVALTELSWGQALATDLVLAVVYAAYGYPFHWLFDRCRPVGRPAGGRA
jgi:uncharacterized membrane protein